MPSHDLVHKAAFLVHMATRMRQLRKDKRLTQAEFAQLVGVDRSELSRYETGQQLPSLLMFVRICRALGVAPDFFLEGAS